MALANAVGFTPTAGIDASAKMIQTSQASAPNADVQMGKFEALPWPDQRFDQVTSIEALYYCPDPAQAFREIVRVLKPQGRFDMIIDYYAESEGTGTWDKGLGFEITRLSTQEWVTVAESVGFRNFQSRRIVNPRVGELAQGWTESVWYPTQESFRNYLKNGAFWLTAYP
ncbi:MAG: methyltransferase domain-containing protein [Acaryochloridaceae cyanobacterium RL_2_7]|nr:methyltransferase domain-containing protein [Acaryochloridaceae cyanobacterium RL_2_7]